MAARTHHSLIESSFVVLFYYFLPVSLAAQSSSSFCVCNLQLVIVQIYFLACAAHTHTVVLCVHYTIVDIIKHLVHFLCRIVLFIKRIFELIVRAFAI